MAKTAVVDTTYLTSKWWILTIKGILAIFAGMAFIFWPGITLVTLVYIFGAYVLMYALLSIMEGLLSIGKVKGSTWVLHLLLGAIQLGIGIYLLRHPLVSFATLILLIGFSLIAHAVFEIVASLAQKQTSATARMLTIVSAVVTGIAGIIVLLQPVASGVTFVWILGLFTLISGPIAIALSLDVKQEQDKLLNA